LAELTPQQKLAEILQRVAEELDQLADDIAPHASNSRYPEMSEHCDQLGVAVSERIVARR
jgi:hypothetical protein